MSNIDFYIKQVQYKLDQASLFYITNDAERAIGLENLLENYYIVALDDSDIFTNLHLRRKNIFSFENARGELNELYRSSAKMLDEEIVKEYIESKSKDFKKKYFQTFKITGAFESRAQEYGAELLNTSARLNMQFENKIPQFLNLSKAGIKFPETEIGKLGDFEFKKLEKQMKGKFVVQFNRGHTGSGTIMIENKEDFDQLRSEFSERPARISKFIEGFAYTVNACVLENGIFAGGLSYQITGVKDIAPSKGSTVGNDFAFREMITDQRKNEILQEIQKIGTAMQAQGFKGLFGVDLIINNDGIFVIEINARQPASIPFYTKLQIKAGQVPLSLLHLTAFLEIKNNLNAEEYSMQNLEPVDAAQVFLRNIEDRPFLVKSRLKTGVYKLAGTVDRMNDPRDESPSVLKINEELDKYLLRLNDGYSIEDIKVDDGGFILLTQLKGKRINSGRELARLQTVQKLVDPSGKLAPWTIEVLKAVKDFYK